MRRRDFLTAASAGVAAAGAGFSPHVFARSRTIRLELVTSWPAALDNLYGTAEFFARRISEATDGEIRCRTYPASAQVGAMEVLDAVASGAFPCGHTAPYYYIGRSPAHGFFTALPFGLSLHEQNAWIHHGGGQELWDELNREEGMVAFPGGNTGAQTGGWFNREIREPSDLRGLRMRFPGHGGRVMARSGVTIQQLPGGEVYSAMNRGLLDAAEWVGPHDDMILGMHRAARYLYLPSWAEPSAMLGFYFNADFWKKLPQSLRVIIASVCVEADARMAASYNVSNPVALEKLVQEHGVEVRHFPKAVLETFQQAAEAVHEQDMKADRRYARIYRDWSAFRDRIRSWTGRTSHAYESFLYGDYPARL